MNTNNIYRWRRQLAGGELRLVGVAEFVLVDMAPRFSGLVQRFTKFSLSKHT